MSMSKKTVLTSLVFISLFFSCKRDASELPAKDAVLSESNVTAFDDPPVEAKKFVEYACITGNCAGTLCEPGKGTCSKEMACTPLPDACAPPKPPTPPGSPEPDPGQPVPTSVANSRLSDQEIDNQATQHALQMVKAGYIDEKDIEASKQLAKSILIKVRNK